MPTPLPEPLQSVIKHRFPVETQGQDWVKFVFDYLPYTKDAGKLFKQQFAYAILHKTITPEEYKKITGDDIFPTNKELYEWLNQAWKMLYPEDSILKEAGSQ